MKPIRTFSFLFGIAALIGAPLLGEPTPAAEKAGSPPPSETPAVTPTAEPPAPAAAPVPEPMPSLEDPEAKQPPLRELTPSAPSAPEAPVVAEKPAAPASHETTEKPERGERPEPARHHPGHVKNQVVTFGDAYLAAGNSAQAVVAILGDAEAHGDVWQGVVAILGDSKATENVGQAVVAILGDATAEKDVGQDVVAVLGDAHVNGHVRGNVVSVLGTVHLGPNARISGEVVSVGGTIDREPGAVIHGNTSQIAFLRHVPLVRSLGQWFHQSISHGRLLAFHPSLANMWVIACAFLALYLLISLAFGNAVTKCVTTFEQRPGRCILTAFLSFIVAPLLMIPLGITIIGLIAFVIALITALLVGKAAFLGWLGRRLGGPYAASRIALAVLIGGVVVLLLYAVPLVGLLLWAAGTALGFGMAVCAALLAMRRDRAPRPAPAAPAFSTTPPVSTVPTSAAFGAVAAPSTISIVPSVPPTTAASAVATPSASSPTSEVPPPVEATVPPVPPVFSAPMPPRPVPPPISTPVSAAGLPRAGFWIRLAASGLDAVLVGVLGGVVHMGDYFLLLLTAYCVVMWALRATTIGGIICGLKIVRLDERPIDWSIALVRVLAGFLSLCVAGLGFMWVAFDPEMQSWHDKVAGTTIVRVPKGTPLV